MKEEIKILLIEALEGDYKDKKTRGELRNGVCYCALGVLVDLYVRSNSDSFSLEETIRWMNGWIEDEDKILTEPIREWAGMKSHSGRVSISEHGWRSRSLMRISDDSTTFEPVIDFIKENWREL